MPATLDDRLPFHVLVPADPDAVIDLYEQSAALQLVLEQAEVIAGSDDLGASL
jgi:hypothetical protein